MREAFYKYRRENFDIYCTWEAWQAACEWQKQIDVEIVLDESVSDTGEEGDNAYNTALKHASKAIINQDTGI